MRIIKKADPKEPETEKTCGKCTTQFAYVQADIKYDREGPYVNCPSCGQFLKHITAGDYYNK